MAVLYENHDVLLFAAMHDTGGMVALEAMHHGLPVVCLKIGGPATMVNGSCGHAVDPAGKTAAQVVAEMGDALIRLAGEPERVPPAARSEERRVGTEGVSTGRSRWSRDK